MNKLYRVLILLVFFGLGISCASAANVTSFNPQTVEVDMGSSQNVRIVMDEVPYGLSGFNITISVLDPEIAEITAVSFPSWNSISTKSTSTVPSSSVWIKSVDFDTNVVPGSTNVSLGNITITGKKAGTTDLGIPKTDIDDDNGFPINPVVITGYISVLDKESPVIHSVSLNNSKPATGDSILLTVNATDNVGVSEVKANGVSLFYQSGTLWSGLITAVEGTHAVNVSAVDAAVNTAWNNSTSYTAVTPDVESPVIHSVSLNNNKPATGDSILLTVNATDNVGVSEVKANGVSLFYQSGTLWSGIITAVEGTHAVNVSAVDAAVNTAWNNSTSYTAVTPDVESPVIHSVSLNNSKPATGDSILLTVNATDNVGVSEVKANGVSLFYQSGTLWSGLITAVEGTHAVNVSAVDAAVNTAWNNSTSYTAVTPDVEFPVIHSVSLNNSKPATGDSILLTVNATDNVGVSEVKANGVSLFYQSGTLWSGLITAVEGTHAVNVSAVDAAVNTAWNNSTSYTAVTPDVESPVIHSVSLNNSKPATGDSILLTVNATDNVGVSEVKANDVSLFYQSGTLWSGLITAVEGTHAVNVSAVDAAVNTAWNNSTSYTAVTPDVESPVIHSVSLNNSKPATGDSILLTVNATDNVGVTEVKANGVSLFYQSGTLWSGLITAVEGTHAVNVSAVDAAVNTAWNNSTSYTATDPELSILPVANFTANPTEGSAPLTVQFTDTSSNSPIEWTWNFGDGTSSTEQNPEHTFITEGVYTVNLTASNGVGSSAVKSRVITVNRVLTPPVANFTANPTEGSAPLTVQFTDTSSNSPTEWTWNFGDGTSSIEQNPEHTFITEGVYESVSDCK